MNEMNECVCNNNNANETLKYYPGTRSSHKQHSYIIYIVGVKILFLYYAKILDIKIMFHEYICTVNISKRNY